MTRISAAKVSASIVTYNNAGEIESCIESLLSHTKGVDFCLYISDNGSEDDTVSRIRKRFPEVAVLENGANLGFGAGHNKVLPLIDSDYHVMVNPDILLKEDAVSGLAAYLDAHPEAGLIMPDILNEDGTRQELPKLHPTPFYLAAGRLPGLKKYRRAYCRSDEALDKPTEIDFCSGCFAMIRTELFRKLGGFDERYFLYMEDADLSREVQKTHKVIFDPEVRVTHAWHRASRKSFKALKLHLASAGKYFRKWRRRGK